MKPYSIVLGLFTVTATSLLAQTTPGADTRPITLDGSASAPNAPTPYAQGPAQAHAEASKPFTVSATVREQYDDNIYTSHDNKVDQFESIVEPSFLFNYPMDQTLISARETFGATYYPDRDKAFDLDNEFTARINHSFSDRFNLDARDRVLYSNQPEISSGAVVNRVSGSYVNNTFTLQGTAQWAPKFSTVSTYTNDYFTYDDPTQSLYNDRDVNVFQHDFRYLLTPTLTLVAGGTFTDLSYDNHFIPAGSLSESSRDWDSITLYAGVDYNFTPQLTAGVRGGGVVTEYDSISGTDLDPYASVFATWQLGARSTLDFNYTHTVAQTGVNSYASQISDNFSLTARYQITSKISARLQGDYNLGDNQGNTSLVAGANNFEEDTLGVTFGLGYDLNQFLNLNLGYTYSNVSSDDSTRSYDRNEISLGVTATY